jgi:hypothetical protein
MVMHRDLIVLVGRFQGDAATPGWEVDCPEAIKGPGWVPIRDVQTIRLEDVDWPALVLEYESFTSAQLMEFGDLEGRALDLRDPSIA